MNPAGWLNLIASTSLGPVLQAATQGIFGPEAADLAGVSRLAKNSLWLFLARVTSHLFLAVFSVLVARQLGASGFGQLAWMLSIIAIANAASTFGTDTLLIRDTARERSAAAGFLGASIWLQLGISAAAIGAINLLSSWTAQPETAQLAAIYSLALFPLAFFSVFSAALRGYERMDLFLLLNLAVSASLLLGAVLLIALKDGLETLVILLLVAQVFGAILAGWLCYTWLPAFRLDWRSERVQIIMLFRMAWPLALLTGIGMLYQRLGILLVAHFLDSASTGWFAVAARVVEAGKVVHFAALGALLPFLSRSALPGSQVAHDGLNRLVLFALLTASLSIALALILLAGPIVLRLFGEAYQPSIAALRILALGLLPFSFAAWASVNLVASGQERSCLAASGLALAAALLLAIPLIRLEGLNGACLAVLSGDVLMAGLYFVLIRS